MSKSNYMCILRSQPGKQQMQQPSPAQMQEMYAKFNAWMETFKENILDMGGKLRSGGKILTPAGLTDGPFIESKEIIGGYMVLSAESYEKAAEVVQGCPGLLAPGNSVEIREISTP